MQLLKAIKQANEFARKLHGRRLNGDLRSKLAASCFAVAQQHHNSILILLSNNPPLQATSFALLRILLESVIRGSWLSHVATDDEVEKFMHAGTKLDMASMMRDLCNFADLTAHKSISKHWSALCAYTHTGELQVQRWLQTKDIEPNYSDQEISELIKLSGFAASLAFKSVLAISSEI